MHNPWEQDLLDEPDIVCSEYILVNKVAPMSKRLNQSIRLKRSRKKRKNMRTQIGLNL